MHIRRVLVTSCCALFCSTVSAAHIGENLCPPTSATYQAVQSGSWQDAATWKPGIPPAGARVLIPSGMTVTNHGRTADVSWIHVAGTLTVCDHCDTQINVHTVYVPMGGAVRLGMPTMPAAGKTVLEFLPGAFLSGDWEKLSRGVICHGEFMACGTEKTAWGIVDGDLAVGATSLVMQDLPYQWKVGDRILIAGTDSMVGEQFTTYQSELRTIVSVSSRTVRFNAPLQYRHFRWRSDLPFHCANLTRNVVIRSRSSAATANRGHLMFMSGMNDIRYAEEVGLGRTDKKLPVTDPRKDSRGLIVAGSNANPRGRYADHVHRAGPLGEPSRRMWVVVDGSPGWGMVNHASHCQWDNCIAINCFGAGFATEEGQERGHMQRCLAALNRGGGDLNNDNTGSGGAIGDWAKDGSGFWLQGGLVDVAGCVAFDNSGHGFGLANLPMNGYPRYSGFNPPSYLRYPIEHDPILLPSDYAGMGAVPSGYVPQRVFADNTAYENKLGFQCWNVVFTNEAGDSWPVAVRGSIRNLTLWGRGAKLHLEYARQLNLQNIKVVGDTVWRPQKYVTTNSDHPVHIRFPEITITGLEIAGYEKKDRSGVTPIFDGEPTAQHRIEGTYPIIGKAGGSVAYPP
ncbi:MAG: G8 domain-containing protein [Planctomycetaceae bacterium]|nr:G8 domain-containing protein [Planctomycetaceae bacterium]